MQNGDGALRIIILASQGLLVKMLITLKRIIYFDTILYTYTVFEVRRNEKKYKEINFGHAWIPTTVHHAVVLQDNL